MKKMNVSQLLRSVLLGAALSTTTAIANDAQPTRTDNAVAQQSTMIVLDSSQSMWGQLNTSTDDRKYATARESLKTLLENAHGSIDFGLLTYGSKVRIKGNNKSKGCNDFNLAVKPADYDIVSLLKEVYRIEPRGRSPVAKALRKAAAMLPPENAHILLVSDGKDSCGSDPCAVARELRADNPSLQIDVIGFREDKNKEEQLECIAENGNGAFVVANDTDRLKTLLAGVQAKAQIIKNATVNDANLPGSVELSIKANGTQPTQRANYSIYTLSGSNVASFTSRLQVKEYLKPGSYRVKAAWQGRSETGTITISPGQTSRLQFDAGAYGLLRLSAVDEKKQPVAVNYSVYLQNGDFISKHVLRYDVDKRVPTGAYRIKADFNGKVLEKQLNVTQDQNKQHVFEFEG